MAVPRPSDEPDGRPSGLATPRPWFIFGDAIALGVLALADLASHEASTERVVHSLEVRDLAGNR